MHSHIYLDESGDLGWKFNHPYRNGGSSRYLTIGYLINPITQCNIPKRLVRDFYSQFGFNPKTEIKASELKAHHKDFICRQTNKMLDKHPDFILGAITTRKEGVNAKFRKDGNTLYNFMMGESLLDHVDAHETCKITRDNRSVKVLSGSSCIDYLQTLTYFHRMKPALLKDNPTDSHTDDGIIFIDWITNIVWSKYEDNYSSWCNLLGTSIVEKQLFF